MYQNDAVLRTYAESGLRTSEEWISLGREIETGAKPRVDTPLRGASVSLYSRNQTHVRPRSRQNQPSAQKVRPELKHPVVSQSSEASEA